MRIHFTPTGCTHSLSWTRLQTRTAEPAILLAIVRLIEGARRKPFTGLGKPEPLRGVLRGLWSRRIDREHRLAYQVEGCPDIDQHIEIAACRGHYRRMPHAH